MISLRFAIFVLAGLFCFLSCEKNSGNSTWSSHLFGIAIQCITFDGEIAWLGTDEGLMRVSKSDTVLFSPDNSPVLTRNITAVKIDPEGRLWFGDGSQGLVIYDGTMWKRLTTFNSPLPSNVISDIVFGDSCVWLASGASAVKVTAVDTVVYNSENAPLPANSVVALDLVSPDEVWIATFGGGIARKNGTTWTTFTTANSSIRNNSIFDVTHDEKGNLWVGEGGGLDVYDGSSWKNFNSLNSELPQNDVTALAAEESGRIWTGMYEGGVASFYRGTWELFDPTNSNIPSMHVLSINIGPNGSIWVGTPLGLAVRSSVR